MMKTVLITGATSGIGLAVARACVRQGFRVLGVGRDADRNARAVAELKAIRPDADATYFCADLGELDETKKVAETIATHLDEACGGDLYGLVHNVGCVKGWYATNRAGYELQFSTNHLAAFVLTARLLPYVVRARGRILMTSSRSHLHTRMRWDDLMFERRYRPLYAYKQSKLANLLFAHELNRRYGPLGIVACGIDPGLVDTGIGQKGAGGLVGFVWRLRRRGGVDPAIPAETFSRLLAASEPPVGFYHGGRGPVPFSREVNDANAARLFSISERLTGVRCGDGR